MCPLEALQVLLDPYSRGHREGSGIVPYTTRQWSHIVSQALVRVPRGLALLLAQEVESHQRLAPRLARVHLYVIADCIGREQSEHGAHREPALGDQRLEHPARIGIQIARR